MTDNTQIDTPKKVCVEAVAELLMFWIDKQMALDEQLLKKEITEDEAQKQYSDLIFWVGSVIMGETDILAKPDGWNIQTVAAGIRSALAKQYAALDAAEREMFKDDETMILFALVEFYQAFSGVLVNLTPEDMSGTVFADRMDALCNEWAGYILTGLK